ncbi:hypothetical protein BKA70DRAFT_1297115 [Coprinopsis sp. MPI-PUGE-AT-0042]|nr:hypothetical protein BKA70DRAFT_1297115 [Coprinopsis sp. MPI-PUGE-AT-0042]
MNLGHLGNLSGLRISLFGFQETDFQYGSFEPLHLPSLRYIAFDNTSLTPCLKFLELLQAEGLKTLRILDMAFFFTNLHGFERYTHLNSIFVHPIYNGQRSEPGWRVMHAVPRFTFSESTLRSLSPFNKLEDFSIGPCYPIHITDAALQDLFSNLPRSKEFEINDDFWDPQYHPPKLTIEGVHNALQSVPLLEKLTLSFDGSILPETLSPPRMRQSLKAWTVCSSKITLPDRFSQWLTTHYPSLSKVDYFMTYMKGLKETFTCDVADDYDRSYMDGFDRLAVMVDRWNTVRRCILARGTKEDGE